MRSQDGFGQSSGIPTPHLGTAALKKGVSWLVEVAAVKAVKATPL